MTLRSLNEGRRKNSLGAAVSTVKSGSRRSMDPSQNANATEGLGAG